MNNLFRLIILCLVLVGCYEEEEVAEELPDPYLEGSWEATLYTTKRKFDGTVMNVTQSKPPFDGVYNAVESIRFTNFMMFVKGVGDSNERLGVLYKYRENSREILVKNANNEYRRFCRVGGLTLSELNLVLTEVKDTVIPFQSFASDCTLKRK